MLKRYPVLSILLFLLLSNANCFAQSTSWRQLTQGIEYQELNPSRLTPWSHIHVFRIDLNEHELDILLAKDIAQRYASIDTMATQRNALIAINGGFFDKKFHPLGLRIGDYQQLNPLKHISWWGIFYTQNKCPNLDSFRQFSRNRKINFAIQSGPRLLVNGQIPPLKPGTAERSAIGLDKNNRVLLLVTDNASMTTTELATIMQSSPLNCTNALNLDGGSSSQLYAKIDGFQLNVHGLSDISDAILVIPTQASKDQN